MGNGARIDDIGITLLSDCKRGAVDTADKVSTGEIFLCGSKEGLGESLSAVCIFQLQI